MHVILNVYMFRGRNSCKRRGGGGGNVKLEKNGKTVICRYSTGEKYVNF